MRKILPILLCFCGIPAGANAVALEDALRATYTACVGIDDELYDLKQMAGINTAITGVGTAAGAGATIVGIVKSAKDAKAESLEKILEEIRERSKNFTPMTDADVEIFLSEFDNAYQTVLDNEQKVQSELEKTVQQSKRLGNWRTGLMAGSTATNVAGAIIAGTNRVKGDLKTQIDACIASVDALRNVMMQARLDGYDITEAEEIADACGEFKFANIDSINNKSTGATISSGVGAATGLVGTILSASANSPSVRDDNSDSGKQKEKNLNTASNVMAGATTAASATATVFNATQIGAIRRVAEIASKCTEVLR